MISNRGEYCQVHCFVLKMKINKAIEKYKKENSCSLKIGAKSKLINHLINEYINKK